MCLLLPRCENSAIAGELPKPSTAQLKLQQKLRQKLQMGHPVNHHRAKSASASPLPELRGNHSLFMPKMPMPPLIAMAQALHLRILRMNGGKINPRAMKVNTPPLI